MAYQSFRELRVWQEAKTLAVEVYRLAGSGDFSRDFGLRDQVRKAAVSIASNIAEGYNGSRMLNSHDFCTFPRVL
jgi:four helix bundle protein